MQKLNIIKGITSSFMFLCVFSACTSNKTDFPNIADSKYDDLRISSNDTSLVKIFDWAVNTSDLYVGDAIDPVGPWYEAALPQREAFCMRDVSHQCIGEEINGHNKENLNMFTKFVENISEEKDYCSYWEISRHNLPAPVDYENDQDFWYNLNANFDVMNAAYRLYEWTGNETYIKDKRFLDFYALTANEYIERWQLGADDIMNRKAIMNERNTSEKKRFKGVRGLPSYEESVPNLKVTGDLLATIYRGLKSYSEILCLNGDSDKSKSVSLMADKYQKLYDTLWWNSGSSQYYSYCLTDETFKEGGTNMFTVWFDFSMNPERVNNILDLMEKKETNVESMSYYPSIFYKYGRNESAYHFLKELFVNDRRDYPEVSSGVIEGVVSGLAGVRVKSSENMVETCPNLTKETNWVAVENIPVMEGKISVLHYNKSKSELVNKSAESFTWRAVFPGKYNKAEKDGEVLPMKHFEDLLGNVYSYVDVESAPGKSVCVKLTE